MISYRADWLPTSYKAKGDFELLILSPPPPECWGYRRVSPMPGAL